jgi:hypothetical protein
MEQQTTDQHIPEQQLHVPELLPLPLIPQVKQDVVLSSSDDDDEYLSSGTSSYESDHRQK